MSVGSLFSVNMKTGYEALIVDSVSNMADLSLNFEELCCQ